MNPTIPKRLCRRDWNGTLRRSVMRPDSLGRVRDQRKEVPS